MNNHECQTCFTEFLAENASTCPKCGSSLAACPGTIVHPAAIVEASEGKEDLPAVREVLQRLCVATYDTTYQSREWESLLDQALDDMLKKAYHFSKGEG